MSDRPVLMPWQQMHPQPTTSRSVRGGTALLQVGLDFDADRLQIALGFSRNARIGSLHLDDSVCAEVTTRMEGQLVDAFDGVTAGQYISYVQGDHYHLDGRELAQRLVVTCGVTCRCCCASIGKSPCPVPHVNHAAVVSAGRVDPDGRQVLECGSPAGDASLIMYDLETVVRDGPCVICGATGVLPRELGRRPSLEVPHPLTLHALKVARPFLSRQCMLCRLR